MTADCAGSYRTTPRLSRAAFDKLPPSARKALAEATFDWAVQPLLTPWRKGLPGYRTGPQIAKGISEWDRRHLAKLKTNRGKR
jgi:hypothetical protein